jgi:protein-L-isoaspartate(D-aspartate) O-methyltransferase
MKAGVCGTQYPFQKCGVRVNPALLEGVLLVLVLLVLCIVQNCFFSPALASDPEPLEISNEYVKRRNDMVDQLARQGVQDPQILEALKTVPREIFLRPGLRFRAYMEEEVPVERHQFLSKPSDWAGALQSLRPPPNARILVIDPGIGYGGALASQMGLEADVVVTVPELYEFVERMYEKLVYSNLFLKSGPWEEGWPDRAPYDRIFIPAVIEGPLPPGLLNQLREEGEVLVGEGSEFQGLVRYIKNGAGLKREVLSACHFPRIRLKAASEKA